jgi:hypothetical protein
MYAQFAMWEKINRRETGDSGGPKRKNSAKMKLARHDRANFGESGLSD